MPAAAPLRLPRADGTLAPYTPGPASPYAGSAAPPRTRAAYAAAHVVADPLADHDPTAEARLDWETTLAYRQHLWRHGLAVAEALDTAQRGQGLDWGKAREMIRRSLAEARALGAGDRIACGAGTDQLAPRPGLGLDEVVAAYEEQCAFVEGEGDRVVLMASRALAAVYGRILAQVSRPVIIHWLGDAFDAALAGYWGSPDPEAAMEVCLGIIDDHAAKVNSVKLSLLDPEREVAMRRRMPAGARMYTGDDFHYPRLIRGDDEGHSDGLLGVFDAIAPAAAAALAALDRDDRDRYDAILGPTLPLARHLFRAPTRHYKTGIVLLAYLNGHQRHFQMVGEFQGARSVGNLAEIFVLADRAGLLVDPDLTAERMRWVLQLAGVE